MPHEQKDISLAPHDQKDTSVAPREQKDTSVVPHEQKDESVGPHEQKDTSVGPHEQKDTSFGPHEQKDTSAQSALILLKNMAKCKPLVFQKYVFLLAETQKRIQRQLPAACYTMGIGSKGLGGRHVGHPGVKA